MGSDRARSRGIQASVEEVNERFGRAARHSVARPIYPPAMSDDFLDLDRSEMGDGLLPETQAELVELALRRSAATGRIVAVTAWTGGDTMSVYDLVDGEPELAGSVPLEHPTPSARARRRRRRGVGAGSRPGRIRSTRRRETS